MASNDGGFPDAPTVSLSELRVGETSGATYELAVIEGPDVGVRIRLDPTRPSRVLIGTSAACDARLTDPGVSRRHAAVEVDGRRMRIVDLGSTNGTIVDGVMIGEAYLRGGETVRMGGTALRVDEGPIQSSMTLTKQTNFGRVIGSSIAMRRLYPLCQKLAQADVPVVIEGETGTGKEALAEALHDGGARAHQPFVVFDCTAVAPNLIESELFGHERGAFTGSVGTRKGVFERANGGTLLIDEIGDLPLELQPKLLRSIERSEVTRMGGQQAMRVDIRILAATRRNLDQETHQGRFRDDLFHRIAVTRIELPPLRRRHGDITMLARHFATAAGAAPDALTSALLARWEAYDWPGNVRELRNAVSRWIALGDLAETYPSPTEDSSTQSRAAAHGSGDDIARIVVQELPLAEARQHAIDAFERRYLDHLLDTHDGNVTRAAAAAGVARRHLQRLKARHGG